MKFAVLLITVLMAMMMLFTSCDESAPSIDNNEISSSDTTQCEHTYTDNVTIEATCNQDGVKTFTCSVCDSSYTETIGATGHKWKNATCTSPKTCSSCNLTEGTVLGHTTSDGICTRCGTDNTNYYIELRNYILLYANYENGVAMTNGEKYWCSEYSGYIDGVKYVLYVKYFENPTNPAKNRVETFVRMDSQNILSGWQHIQIVYTENSNNVYLYEYTDTCGNAKDKMYGFVDATSITSEINVLPYTEYSCGDGYHSATKISQNAAKQLKIHLRLFDNFLKQYPEMSIDDLGFKNY